MGNQKNINGQNNQNIGRQINIITTVHNEPNSNQVRDNFPEIETKACSGWFSFVITGIAVLSDILSIRSMISYNPIKLLLRLEDQGTKEINIRFYVPLAVISISLILFAILYNLLRKKHFYRIIRKDNKLYFISKVKCANCEKQTFAKLNYNWATEQFTFTCKNCRHRFTYNFSELYKTLK